MFQPIVRSQRTDTSDETIFLLIHHHRSLLVSPFLTLMRLLITQRLPFRIMPWSKSASWHTWKSHGKSACVSKRKIGRIRVSSPSLMWVSVTSIPIEQIPRFASVEVYEDNRIRINFDGWTSTFDYTVETDHSDLHPCGYWEYVQRVLYKNVNTSKISPHFTFSRYDKPKCKSMRIFSLVRYLCSVQLTIADSVGAIISQRKISNQCHSNVSTM